MKCRECGKEYKVVPYHVVISIDKHGDLEDVDSACFTEYEKRTLFENLAVYDRFAIEEEPESLFYKIDNRYDGAVNARQIKSRNNRDMFKPVIFSKGYVVQKTKE